MLPRRPRSTLFPYTNALPIYLDPVTGVRITKITSAAVPQVEQSPGIFVNNDSMHVDYAEGGPFISREWGSLQHSVLVQIGRGTRLNSSHQIISYAVFCLKKKK